MIGKYKMNKMYTILLSVFIVTLISLYFYIVKCTPKKKSSPVNLSVLVTRYKHHKTWKYGDAFMMDAIVPNGYEAHYHKKMMEFYSEIISKQYAGLNVEKL
jgi:hypothetical protein